MSAYLAAAKLKALIGFFTHDLCITGAVLSVELSSQLEVGHFVSWW